MQVLKQRARVLFMDLERGNTCHLKGQAPPAQCLRDSELS